MIIFSAGNGHLKKYIFFNYGAELQINKATIVRSLDRCQVCITGSILRTFAPIATRDLKIQDGSEDDGRPEVIFP